MSKGLVVFLGVIVLSLSLLAFVVMGALGLYNGAIQMEQTLTAQYDQNRNNYSKMFNSLREAAQVPEMYIDGLKKVYDSVMVNRYGKDGSKAMFNWIKEHNPNVDSSLYTKLQSMIEANRNEFESNQKSLIDKKQIYQVYLKTMPQSFVLGFLGFPKIDLDKYSIVTSDETEAAFDTKKAGPISLNPNTNKGN